MATRILIPTPLRHYTDKKDVVEVEASTVGEALEGLIDHYEPLRKQLLADDGTLRSYVNIYVNDEDIRYAQKENTPVSPKDVISIVPSIAGGSGKETQ